MNILSQFSRARLVLPLLALGAIAVFLWSRSSGAILPIAKAVDPDACADASAPANLLTYLGLEDAAGTATDSFDAKPGTLVNGPVWTASGKVNRGLVFDGVDDHVTLGFNPSSFVNAFTLEAWAYPTKTNTLSYNQGIISNDNAAVQGIELSVGWASPTAACTVTTSATRVGISAATTLNAWHHFTCTYNGATLRLYDNGAQVASAAATGTVFNNGVNLTLGRSLVYGIPAEEYFGGTLDEVAIYDRAISPTEVSAHYQKGLAGNGYCVAVCGNSVTEGAETCDDGNALTEACSYGLTNCTVCNNTCQSVAGATSFCGNSAVDGAEACDDGNALTEACAYGLTTCTVCNNTCQNTAGATSYCGNSVIGGGESCDDGNLVSNDGCSSACVSEITPGGGGGGGAGNINSSSNSSTSSVTTNIPKVNGNQSYASPVRLDPKGISVDSENQTKSSQVTEEGSLKLKPNPKSGLSLTIPPNTTVQGPMDWNGKIMPPMIRPSSFLGSKGKPIRGSQEKLTPKTAAVVVEVGTPDESLTFSKKVQIVIPVRLTNGSRVILYSSNDGAVWNRVGTALVVNGTITVKTSQTGYLAAKSVSKFSGSSK